MNRVWQQIVIARLPGLRFLDGTSVSTFYQAQPLFFVFAYIPYGNDSVAPNSFKISERQRVDAELLYLSHIAREFFPSDAARAAAHPRWAELCKGKSTPIHRFILFGRLTTIWSFDIEIPLVHGTPNIVSDKDDRLKNHLIGLHLTLLVMPTRH